ncbi:MAG: MBOAT family O-acyltransferase [Clostridia bacterium]
MLFSSGEFMLFFPIVCILYYAIPQRFRHIWLLGVSYFFYICFSPTFAILLLALTLLSYAWGLLLQREGLRCRKLWTGIGIALLFAPLVFFKYAQFILNNLSAALGLAGISYVAPTLSFLIPVGISFYTFQAIGYVIDVYRGTPAEHNLLRYGAFLSFFPILASGPIERSDNLLRQLREEHLFDTHNIKRGLLMMLWGFFLKLVLADRLALFVTQVFDNYTSYAGLQLAVGALFFGVQLYCDFASYSFLALGAGEVMGFSLINNFNTPYFSLSISEFWRRWHISLSSWFRDYLYIPLGGNRKGKVRKYFNIMVVFLVSGLWHGSAWNYIAWGALNGLYQVIGDLFKPLRQKLCRLLHIDINNSGNRILRMIFTFLLVNFAWIFFRAPSLRTALSYVKRMFSVWNPWVLVNGSLYKMGLNQANFTLVLIAMGILFWVSVCQYRGIDLRERLLSQGLAFRWIVYLLCIFFVLIFGIYGPGYSAASFIYFQF